MYIRIPMLHDELAECLVSPCLTSRLCLGIFDPSPASPLLCQEDFHVVNNACVACPAGAHRAAGDNALGSDTECDGALTWLEKSCSLPYGPPSALDSDSRNRLYTTLHEVSGFACPLMCRPIRLICARRRALFPHPVGYGYCRACK